MFHVKQKRKRLQEPILCGLFFFPKTQKNSEPESQARQSRFFNATELMMMFHVKQKILNGRQSS